MDMDASIEFSSQLFHSESKKLQKIIELMPEKSATKIPDIINLYYQATMVRTLAKKIKSDLESPTPESQNLFDQINKTERYLNEKFSKSLHPEILSQLATSIQTSTDNLKLLGKNPEQKTK